MPFPNKTPVFVIAPVPPFATAIVPVTLAAVPVIFPVGKTKSVPAVADEIDPAEPFKRPVVVFGSAIVIIGVAVAVAEPINPFAVATETPVMVPVPPVGVAQVGTPPTTVNT
ncbi:MAG: hypothetical protein H7320_19990 [Ferruginibacter sp.]|nr:hypothetical protein [Ferruginibacter sp.]